MIVKKKDLLTALNKVKNFKPSWGDAKIIIDGVGNRVIGKRDGTIGIFPLQIEKSILSIDVPPKGIEVPGEEFLTEIESLSKNQLESLAEYTGVDGTGTKAVIVRAIFDASVKSAEHQRQTEATSVIYKERICIDLDKLLSVVKSLDCKGDEDVSLRTNRHYVVDKGDNSGEEVVEAKSIVINDSFELFCLSEYHSSIITFPETHLNKQHAGKIPVSALKFTAAITEKERNYYSSSYKKMVQFDMELRHIVACDGHRIHAYQLPNNFSADIPTLRVSGDALRNVCAAVDCENIELVAVYDPDGQTDETRVSYLLVQTEKGENIFISNIADQIAQMNLKDLFDEIADMPHHFSLYRKDFENGVKQAKLINKEMATLKFNGNLNIGATATDGRFNSEEVSYVGGKSGHEEFDGEISFFLRPTYCLDAVNINKGMKEIEVSFVGDPEKGIAINTGDNMLAYMLPLRQ